MSFRINTHEIGGDSPVYVIAELSANHNHDFQVALDTIHAMKEAGADAVKLQTYTADTITIDCKNDYFTIDKGTIWDGKTLYDLYKEAYTPWDWQPKLMKEANKLGMDCFSSPFDASAVDFLEDMNVPAYKIASFEITDIPLIEYVAGKGKPVIISTGIATLEDIQDALAACKRAGNEQVALLKCTSAYPAPVEDANLHTMVDMQKRFGVVTGLSDHTTGISVPITATALGAKIIEKHFILDRTIGGPDAAFSLEPQEFKQMVTEVRNAEKALGRVTYQLTDKIKNSRMFSRSLFAVKDIKKGDVITEENVRSIRPGNGLAPKYLPDILGKTAMEDIPYGTPVQLSMINEQ